MNTQIKLQGGMGGDDPLPTSPEPLSPRRTDLKPDDEAGVDELPDNDGETPLETDEEALRQENMADVDVANAEFDDQPNPR